jgi:hypothetical protein
MELAQESLAGRMAILRMSSLSQHEIYGSNAHLPFEPTIGNIKKRAKMPSRSAQRVNTNAFGMVQCPGL